MGENWTKEVNLRWASWLGRFVSCPAQSRPAPRQIQFLDPQITLYGLDCEHYKFLNFEKRLSEAESSP